MRRCSKCTETKSEDHFIRRSDRPWLFLAICRECRIKIKRKWEADNPHKHRQYVQLRNAKRRGACGWCWGKESKKGKLYFYLVDNKTGQYHEECVKEIELIHDSEVIKYEAGVLAPEAAL